MGKMGDSEFQISYEKFLSAYVDAADEYLGQGVTLAQNAWATKTLLGYFGQIANESQPPIDTMVLPAGFLEPKLTAGEARYSPARTRQRGISRTSKSLCRWIISSADCLPDTAVLQATQR